MSLMTMRHKMASKRTITVILWFLIVVFVVGIVFMYLPGGGRNDMFKTSQADPAEVKLIVATVNGDKINAAQLNGEFFNRQSDQMHYDISNAVDARAQVFDDMVQRTITDQVSKDFGIRIWSWTRSRMLREVALSQLAQMHDQAKQQAKSAADAAKKPAEKKNLKSVETLYKEAIASRMQQFGSTEKNPDENDYVSVFMRSISAPNPRTGETPDQSAIDNYIKTRIIGHKVLTDAYKDAALSEDFVRKLNTQEVKARWIFVEATDKSAKGLQNASKQASDLREGILKNPETFGAVAAKESDDAMTKSAQGLLGANPMSGATDAWVRYGGFSMVPAVVEYQAFAQKKAEVGPVVAVTIQSMFSGSTQIGYGFVRVEDIRNRDDAKSMNWAQEKRLAMAAAKVRYEAEFGRNYVQLKTAQATIVRKAKELQYLELRMTNPMEAKSMEKSLLNVVSIPPVVRAAYKYDIAKDVKDPLTRANMLEEVIQFSGTMSLQLELETGEAFLKAGDKSKAIQQFANAELEAENADKDADHAYHLRLKAAYKQLGDQKAVLRMDKWIKDNPKKENPGGGMGMPLNIGQ